MLVGIPVEIDDHVQPLFSKCRKLCKLPVLRNSWSFTFKGHVYSCMTCNDLIEHIHDPSYTKNNNILGKCLMEVRDELNK